MPESKPVRKVAAARASVTENDAVGEPAQGTIPRRLHPKTKKKSVHSMGTKLSPRCAGAEWSLSWPWPGGSSMAGRATLSRINTKKASKRFANLPFGGAPEDSCFATRVKISTMTAATTSSRIMYLEMANPDFGA